MPLVFLVGSLPPHCGEVDCTPVVRPVVAVEIAVATAAADVAVVAAAVVDLAVASSEAL